ncbi:hypothetical protein FQZ97_1054530 [compost metagenome]
MQVAEHHLGDLGDIAGAGIAQVVDTLANGSEDRFALFEDLFVAPDQNGQGTGGSAFGTTGDRGIERADTFLVGQGTHFAPGVQVVGAQLNPDGTFAHAGDQPIFGAGDFLDDGRRRQ